MKFYQSKCSLLPGTSYDEVLLLARAAYKQFSTKTRRTPYLNAKYKGYKTPKIFLDLFWTHIFQKKPRERFERLKLYSCALDTLRNTQTPPEAQKSFDKDIRLYRIYGVSRNGKKFCVQIKEELKTGRKYFMSVFPWNRD
ncbi:MAG: hypothetical protein LBM12_03090 [Candidatus Nomurabacteria bacterium]|jgi:hypothetical protein|nr:hypothetical protein [Candidatus Nomurabacteria bacterium]